jgi:hypothetical protein
MPNTRLTLARGTVDGTNILFYTPEPYVAGSTAYVLNGRVYSQFAARGISNPFGYAESNPDTGEIQVDFAPQPGDIVQIFFWDRQPTREAQVKEVEVIVAERQEIIGVVQEPVPDVIVGIVQEK